MYEKYMDRFFAGELLAASRLMSIVEEGGEEAEKVLSEIFPKVGRAYRIGITGFTGAGKSTLINTLSKIYRSRGKTIGVVAVDPTSPFSGGALLGDRIRMTEASMDDGFFVRSVASRGSETGLSHCADELADILDAFGREIIFMETVGIGQQEYKVRFSVQTTVVVLVPDAGDDIQSLKSGLMEIGDIFVVNKADRLHAQRYADDLRNMLRIRYPRNGWRPPVLTSIATKGEGIEEIVSSIDEHRVFLESNGDMVKMRERALRNRIVAVVEEKLRERFWEDDIIKGKMEAAMKSVLSGGKSPYEAARELVDACWENKGRGDRREKEK